MTTNREQLAKMTKEKMYYVYKHDVFTRNWGPEYVHSSYDKALKEAKRLCKKVLKQLKRKEQECEELKKNLHQNFKEKDGLHIIIDRLLEAGGYDTNTASAEDFEDVYKNMRYEQQQLDQLKQTLAEIKEIAERELNVPQMVKLLHVQKLSKSYKKIRECEVKNENRARN